MKSDQIIKALVVEDDPVSRKLLLGILSKIKDISYDIVSAGTLQEALKITTHLQFDIILLDLNLPDSYGADTFNKMQENNYLTAIIVITGNYDQTYGLEIIRNGAQDYLCKGKFDAYALHKSILYALEHKRIENEKNTLQKELTQAQKLESIGTLAAGVAHEINTPIQFIANNTGFIKKAVSKLLELINEYRGLLSRCDSGENTNQAIEESQRLEKKAKFYFFEAEIPRALSQSEEGLERVTNIVKAMKDFSHMGSEEMSLEDINKAIESTITISRNEWKYVAEIKTELDLALPMVKCSIGDIKQVILNLIVNAAHTIKDALENSEDKLGTITIRTYKEDSSVFILVSDTGTGIPEGAQAKVFDHFFTTKEVGKGTGQGLSMAYQTIVEKHKGNLSFETENGKGTTFIIQLPI